MVEWRCSLDQRGRAGLRVHQQRRNDKRDDQPGCHERRGEVGSSCRLHFPYSVYLDAKQAIRRRAMGRVVGSNAAVLTHDFSQNGNVIKVTLALMKYWS
jgi:hypothetical protein